MKNVFQIETTPQSESRVEVVLRPDPFAALAITMKSETGTSGAFLIGNIAKEHRKDGGPFYIEYEIDELVCSLRYKGVYTLPGAINPCLLKITHLHELRLHYCLWSASLNNFLLQEEAQLGVQAEAFINMATLTEHGHEQLLSLAITAKDCTNRGL